MTASVLSVRDARRRLDEHELLSFRCWNGDPDEEYVQEVEEYVRRFALSTAHKTLLFHDASGLLVGVTAFDRADVQLTGRSKTAVWRLEVIALAMTSRGLWTEADIEGCASPMKASEFLLRKSFQRMLELDPRRAIVVGRIHDDNRLSMRVCARVGLVRTEREDNGVYWRLLGEADPAAGPVT